MITIPSKREGPLSVPDRSSRGKCGSVLIPQNLSCPICDPRLFYESVGQGMISMDMIIGQSLHVKDKIVCLAFDLAIPDATLA